MFTILGASSRLGLRLCLGLGLGLSLGLRLGLRLGLSLSLGLTLGLSLGLGPCPGLSLGSPDPTVLCPEFWVIGDSSDELTNWGPA